MLSVLGGTRKSFFLIVINEERTVDEHCYGHSKYQVFTCNEKAMFHVETRDRLHSSTSCSR